MQDKMKQNMDDVKFTMIDQSYEKIGNSGIYRIQLIKDWFRKIIDNIVTTDYKAFFAILNSMSYEKWLNSVKATPDISSKPIKRF